MKFYAFLASNLLFINIGFSHLGIENTEPSLLKKNDIVFGTKENVKSESAIYIVKDEKSTESGTLLRVRKVENLTAYLQYFAQNCPEKDPFLISNLSEANLNVSKVRAFLTQDPFEISSKDVSKNRYNDQTLTFHMRSSHLVFDDQEKLSKLPAAQQELPYGRKIQGIWELKVISPTLSPLIGLTIDNKLELIPLQDALSPFEVKQSNFLTRLYKYSNSISYVGNFAVFIKDGAISIGSSILGNIIYGITHPIAPIITLLGGSVYVLTNYGDKIQLLLGGSSKPTLTNDETVKILNAASSCLYKYTGAYGRCEPHYWRNNHGDIQSNCEGRAELQVNEGAFKACLLSTIVEINPKK